ncbi:MAG: hypothetical protein JSS65_08065, partial [Armatimonadetes bacterium]|nr:hypothetical protein [Armatimonadota bacterium]
LAAILFPVFAQAKAAAKQTQNISNLKNTSLAVIMYTGDYDDTYPLAQRYEPSNAAFFGIEPWVVSVQPYIKNYGVFVHPLGPALPSDPALAAWHQGLYYGMLSRAATNGATNYQADTSVGSFARRVCNSKTTKYDGLLGQGCDPVAGCGFYAGTAGTTVPSLSTTAVNNPADVLLMAEAAQWDMWAGIGVANPFTYGVYWTPANLYAANGYSYSMAGPDARRNPKPQFDPAGISTAKCTPADLCDGYLNFGIVNGTTTFAATDGHAKASDYRGGIMAQADVGADHIIKAFWPAGGY